MDNNDFLSQLQNQANKILIMVCSVMKLFRLDPVLNAEEQLISCYPNEVLPMFLGCYVDLLPHCLHMRFNLPFCVVKNKENFAVAITSINHTMTEGAFYYIPGNGHAYFKISSMISENSSGRNAAENMIRTVSKAMKVITPMLQKLENGEISLEGFISEVDYLQSKTVTDIYCESYAEKTFQGICSFPEVSMVIPEKLLGISVVKAGRFSKNKTPFIAAIYADAGSKTLAAVSSYEKVFPDKVKSAILACVTSANQSNKSAGFVDYDYHTQRFSYKVTASIRDAAFASDDSSMILTYCISGTSFMIEKLDELQNVDFNALMSECSVKEDERFPYNYS